MVNRSLTLRVGDDVLVPWGLDEVRGRVVEVWGDPPSHVRVELDLGDGEAPEVLLLNPSVVHKAA